MNSLQEQELERLKEEVTGFKVNDSNTANWCFRKIQALQDRIQENKALADGERLRIDDWEEKEIHQDMESINYLSSLVKQYYVEQKEKDKKFKLSTPYGKITCRKTKKYKYDELTLKEYCKENGYMECIKVSEDLNKTEFKKMFPDGINKDTGEVLDGVVVEEVENIAVKVE